MSLIVHSHSVAGVLAEEIISDVKNICMLGTDEEDDFGPLRRHFLTGRGWRSLAVLYALPLQVLLSDYCVHFEFI